MVKGSVNGEFEIKHLRKRYVTSVSFLFHVGYYFALKFLATGLS